MMPEVPNIEYTFSAEKARDNTLNGKNASQHVTSVLLMALDNQPEAFASDLGDDQSRYLLIFTLFPDGGLT